VLYCVQVDIGNKAFANSVVGHTEGALSLEEIRFVPSEGPDWSPSRLVRPCESVIPLLSVPLAWFLLRLVFLPDFRDG